MYCSLASIGHAAIITIIIIIIIIIYAPTMTTHNVTRGMAPLNHKRPGQFYAREKLGTFEWEAVWAQHRFRLFGEE